MIIEHSCHYIHSFLTHSNSTGHIIPNSNVKGREGRTIFHVKNISAAICKHPLLPAESLSLHKKYTDFADVLGEKGAAVNLPLHLTCTINQKPPAHLVGKRQHPIYIQKFAILNEFPDYNLKEVFTCPSTSPASAPPFFAPKKNNS